MPLPGGGSPREAGGRGETLPALRLTETGNFFLSVQGWGWSAGPRRAFSSLGKAQRSQQTAADLAPASLYLFAGGGENANPIDCYF